MSRIRRAAKAQGLDMVLTEGGNHTKVQVGARRSVVPRHNEINEITAKAILKQLEVQDP